MYRLNRELIDIIVDELAKRPPPPLALNPLAPPPPRTPLSNYASISPVYKASVEKRNMERIRIKSSDEEFSQFTDIFEDPIRRSYLRRLEFVITSPDDFVAWMQELFGIIHSWEPKEPEEPEGPEKDDGGRLRLQISVNPGRAIAPPGRYAALPADEPVPALDANGLVSVLHVDGTPHAVHPAAVKWLTSKLPGLVELYYQYRDPANRLTAKRTQHLAAMDELLEELKGPGHTKVTKLTLLRITATDIRNHSFSAPDITGGNHKPFLSKLPSQLREVVANDMLITSSAFACQDGDECLSSLENFDIRVNLVGSDGKWFYTGDPESEEAGMASPEGSPDSDDSDDEEETDDDEDDEQAHAVENGRKPTHEWRSRPDPDLFNKLVSDMTDAVFKMPKLRTGRMDIAATADRELFIQVGCAMPGQRIHIGKAEDDNMCRRWIAYIEKGAEWEIPGELYEKWEKWVGEDGAIDITNIPNEVHDG
jgi:hypothetical protein